MSSRACLPRKGPVARLESASLEAPQHLGSTIVGAVWQTIQGSKLPRLVKMDHSSEMHVYLERVSSDARCNGGDAISALTNTIVSVIASDNWLCLATSFILKSA